MQPAEARLKIRQFLKRHQLPLSSARIRDRESLEAPGYFGNPKRLSFLGGASIADRLTREKIRTHFPTLKAPMPVWRNWQTPGTQNPVSARTCGFDPRHRHQRGKPADEKAADFFICIPWILSVKSGGERSKMEAGKKEMEKVLLTKLLMNGWRQKKGDRLDGGL